MGLLGVVVGRLGVQQLIGHLDDLPVRQHAGPDRRPVGVVHLEVRDLGSGLGRRYSLTHSS